MPRTDSISKVSLIWNSMYDHSSNAIIWKKFWLNVGSSSLRLGRNIRKRRLIDLWKWWKLDSELLIISIFNIQRKYAQNSDDLPYNNINPNLKKEYFPQYETLKLTPIPSPKPPNLNPHLFHPPPNSHNNPSPSHRNHHVWCHTFPIIRTTQSIKFN